MTVDPRLEPLAPLIGEWRTTITMLNNGGDGAVYHATDSYRWSASGMFVIHEVDAMMGDDRIQSFEVIALAPAGSGFTLRSYEPDGTFADYAAEMNENRWSITGAIQKFAGSVAADGRTISGQWDNRADDAWQPQMRVKLVKD